MTEVLIECVPNFSEGKNQAIIDAIVDSAQGFTGAQVLSAEPDPDYNRTVVTIAGSPDAVLNSVAALIKKSAELIDMSSHSGNHPRIGAVDVCPFVPLSKGSESECERCARELPELIGDLPYFYYGTVASHESRQKLASLRKGQYEGLRERLEGGDWANESTRYPDSWSGEWDDTIAKFGVMAIGVRPILVAYNVNVNEKDATTSKIAGSLIRTSGRLLKAENGSKTRITGMLENVQGMGVTLPAHEISQVSMNLTDVSKTSMHLAFEAVRSIVNDHGIDTCGSELVGLVPLSAMLDSGRWYHSEPETASDEDLVNAAIKGLGLDYLAPFDANASIIEWALGGN